MPTVAERITIAAPPDEVWPLLSDPATVASCIPGATLSPDQDGDAWKGSIRVKFGPTVAVFRGEATLNYDHGAKRCTIEGRGIDQRGASRALANGVVSATGTSETELAVEGEYSVSGPLETFANAGGVHVARALLAEFAKNMGDLVAERRANATGDGAAQSASSETAAPAATGDGHDSSPGTGPRPGASPPQDTPPAPAGTSGAQTPAPAARPARQAAELNAFALFWAALKSWFSSLFGKRS